MGWLAGLVVDTFLMVTMILAFLSMISADPMKSAMSLVGSLLFLLPVVSYGIHIWYSYYICLLFLSGIFVVIVYFSSLSSFIDYEYGFMIIMSLVLMGFIIGLGGGVKSVIFDGGGGLGLVVTDTYMFIYVWLVGVMFIFLGFMSYILTFEGALRKI